MSLMMPLIRVHQHFNLPNLSRHSVTVGKTKCLTHTEKTIIGCTRALKYTKTDINQTSIQHSKKCCKLQ